MERGAGAWRSCRRGPGACDGAGRGAGRPRPRGDHDCAHAGRRRGQCHGAAALSSVPGCCRARGEHRGAAGPAGSDPAVHGAAPRAMAIPTCACWPPSWRATCRRKMPPNCCAVCSSTSSIQMSVRRRSMCWRRLGRAMLSPRFRPVPSDLPERRFCHSRCR